MNPFRKKPAVSAGTTARIAGNIFSGFAAAGYGGTASATGVNTALNKLMADEALRIAKYIAQALEEKGR